MMFAERWSGTYLPIRYLPGDARLCWARTDEKGWLRCI